MTKHIAIAIGGLVLMQALPPQQSAAPVARPPQRFIGGTPSGPPTIENYAAFDGHAALTPIVAPPEALGLDPFYRKYVDADGIPIVLSNSKRHSSRRTVADWVRRVDRARA